METIENLIKLKDGREIYTTHNGFKYFVKSKKGRVEEVTEKYYQQAKRLKAK